MSVYIGATRQNDGKTVVSLGLLSVLRRKIKNIGYMKPIGQQYLIVNGRKIDKDAVLMQKIFNFKSALPDMSPIAIPSGFTENYILRGKRSTLVRKIQSSYKRLRQKHDFVLIEGTGHAGVGSVFDMSNSDVAHLLKTKVIIVSCGGIGKPIDEIMLNCATFINRGVEIIGVIVNKVKEEKYNKINRFVTKGLARKNVDVLGVIPFENILSNPTISELLEDLDGELLFGETGLDRVVERFVIGDMVAHECLNYLSGGTLLIVPGNRQDIIFSALSGWVLGVGKKYHISGIIATYGKKPPKNVVEIIKKAGIPLILVKGDSFTTACEIDRMIFKLRAEDKDKIIKTEELIRKYVDVDKIIEKVNG
ncbi:MAG: AAA family ATPase [bacterium]